MEELTSALPDALDSDMTIHEDSFHDHVILVHAHMLEFLPIMLEVCLCF